MGKSAAGRSLFKKRLSSCRCPGTKTMSCSAFRFYYSPTVNWSDHMRHFSRLKLIICSTLNFFQERRGFYFVMNNAPMITVINVSWCSAVFKGDRVFPLFIHESLMKHFHIESIIFILNTYWTIHILGCSKTHPTGRDRQKTQKYFSLLSQSHSYL